ncbi:GNAT family N-acetyltransferase [Photorhabdus heterorhabditis]|uniref:GNAT family N-acetyltransferase n=1 Tax=Photorhabdus heterorhabditis TaxID=880156 RepID=A0A5B0WUT1_9GAMM|nr:GNAT family N-acetyltransferase [Photorhabdus heterorhabditis]KAA1190187.1 GNAT family N-acetyltransferase [Photorhabdus heterorhabditis]
MLKNERIMLVEPTIDLADTMYSAIKENREHLSRYMSWVKAITDEESFIENMKEAVENFNKCESELRFSIIRLADNRFLGALGLIVRDKSIPFFEMGYWLCRDAVGLGYVSDGVKLLERYAFENLKAKRIEIRMAACNMESRKVAERNNYQLEGILKCERRLPSGEIDDTAIYSKCMYQSALT